MTGLKESENKRYKEEHTRLFNEEIALNLKFEELQRAIDNFKKNLAKSPSHLAEEMDESLVIDRKGRSRLKELEVKTLLLFYCLG